MGLVEGFRINGLDVLAKATTCTPVGNTLTRWVSLMIQLLLLSAKKKCLPFQNLSS
jgi:hypothetical protein